MNKTLTIVLLLAFTPTMAAAHGNGHHSKEQDGEWTRCFENAVNATECGFDVYGVPYRIGGCTTHLTITQLVAARVAPRIPAPYTPMTSNQGQTQSVTVAVVNCLNLTVGNHLYNHSFNWVFVGASVNVPAAYRGPTPAAQLYAIDSFSDSQAVAAAVTFYGIPTTTRPISFAVQDDHQVDAAPDNIITNTETGTGRLQTVVQLDGEPLRLNATNGAGAFRDTNVFIRLHRQDAQQGDVFLDLAQSGTQRSRATPSLVDHGSSTLQDATATPNGTSDGLGLTYFQATIDAAFGHQ